MMGNIFARHKGDVPTAMKYYDEAVKLNPNDNIAVNNIGANLMRQGKLDEARIYLEKALSINQEYSNTHYALAMLAEAEQDLQTAFKHAINALKVSKQQDQVFQHASQTAISLAQKIIKSDDGKKLLKKYIQKLEYAGDRKIEIIADSSIPTAAKMEFAENYGREHHLIKYKPDYKAVEHLQMHELVHLDFVIQAREANNNKLFVSTQNHKRKFITGLEPTVRKLNKMGVPDESIANYCNAMFEGINRQVFNAPIDLFIEDFLYYEFPHLQAFQFISLYTIVKEGIHAVTDKQVVELSPKDIISKSKIYNMLGALQLKELFGFDFLKDFKAANYELMEAKTFYNEFKQLKNSRKPAEEYQLVERCARKLKLDKNFELVDENSYRSPKSDMDSVIDSLKNDPLGVESDVEFKEEERRKFLESQSQGVNMAVAMYIVDALQHFKNVPTQKVKEIAFEIAMLGTQGINPDSEKKYKLATVSAKEFTGLHLIAWYYASWAYAIPEMVEKLGLPYEQEYQIAQTLL